MTRGGIITLLVSSVFLFPAGILAADPSLDEVAGSLPSWPVSFAGGSRQTFDVTGAGPLELLLELPPPDIREEAGIDTISLDGLSTSSSPGLPQLPFGLLEVTLPEGAVPASVRLQVVEVVERDVEGTYDIAPAPPLPGHPEEPVPGEAEEDSSLPVGYRDPAVYELDALYPRSATELASVTTRGDAGRLLPIARIACTPLRYNPVTGRLRFAERMRLQLSFKSDPSLLRRPAVGGTYDYVIVTSNVIRDGSAELANFVAHKTSQGHSVKVVTQDDYGSLVGPYPNGTAEKIRKWLQNNWQSMGIQYVLLIGNPDPADPMYERDFAGDVPMKMVWWGTPLTRYAFGVPTDWYYADLVGTWDADGDGFYGETPWMPQADVPTSYLYPAIPRSGFLARFDGTISIPAAKNVTFDLDQWKGASLWVDGQEILDHWPQTDRKSNRSTVRWLDAGSHSVTVYYFQDTGHGHLRLNVDGSSPGGFNGSFWLLSMDFNDPPVVTGGPWTLNLNWETSDYTAPIPEMGIYPPDLDAEVAVGRIPVYEHELAGTRGQVALATLDTILRKIIRYENQLPPKWRRKVLLPMKTVSSGFRSSDLGEAIYHYLLPENFAAYRVYDDDYGLADPPDVTPCTPANVTDAWNQGFGMITWWAHGDYHFAEQVLNAELNVPNLDSRFQVFTFQASCQNGTPILPECYGDPVPCQPAWGTYDGRLGLAYSLLKEKAVTAVAATAPVVFSHFGDSPYSRYSADFAYFYTDRIINGRLSAGDALKDVKYTHWFLPGVEKEATYRDQLIFTLYGDPSTALLMPEFSDDYSHGTTLGDQDWEEVSGDWSVTGALRRYKAPPDGTALAIGPSLAGSLARLKFRPAVDRGPRSLSVLFDYKNSLMYRMVKVEQGRDQMWRLKLVQAGYFDGESPGVKKSVYLGPLNTSSFHTLKLATYEDGLVKVYLDGVRRLVRRLAANSGGRFGLKTVGTVTYFDDVLIWDGSWLP